VHFDKLMNTIGGRFARVEPRRHARDFVLGLLSDLPIKDCWTLSEHVGAASLMDCSQATNPATSSTVTARQSTPRPTRK
jgi:hypothetical protein